jgi:cytoskeletal protein CcmA (bactofilin family)
MAKESTNNSGSIYNALTYGSVITGNIVSDNDFRIDGEVQGDMHCKGKVVIGQTGKLKGTITCANAEIIGTVIGDIDVSETVTLRSTANFNGEIKTKVLVVEPNALFNGTCSMQQTVTDTE